MESKLNNAITLFTTTVNKKKTPTQIISLNKPYRARGLDTKEPPIKLSGDLIKTLVNKGVCTVNQLDLVQRSLLRLIEFVLSM